jgi:HlyD family secretion protein
MFVTVDVFYGESEEATVVPLSALYEEPETGAVGVYVGTGDLAPELGGEIEAPPSMSLTHPVSFEFVPTEVIAQGRMEAAIRGVPPGAWVVTLGQNLLRGKTAQARVRPVTWQRVERLQRLQREDMMQDVIERETTEPTP